MPILQIDTYDRAIFESVMPFTDESLSDRVDFLTLPPDVQELMKEHVAAGRLPATRQPADGMVIDGDKIIVTITWLDLKAAQDYVADKLSRNIISIISSVVEVRD